MGTVMPPRMWLVLLAVQNAHTLHIAHSSQRRARGCERAATVSRGLAPLVLAPQPAQYGCSLQSRGQLVSMQAARKLDHVPAACSLVGLVALTSIGAQAPRLLLRSIRGLTTILLLLALPELSRAMRGLGPLLSDAIIHGLCHFFAFFGRQSSSAGETIWEQPEAL